MKIEKETAIQKVKAVGNLIAGGSTFMLIDGVMGAIMPPQVNAIVRFGMFVGSSLLSGCVGSRVCKYVDDSIDAAVQNVEELKKEYGPKFKELKEVINENSKIEELG